MNLLLIRHGEPDYATDSLTEEGRRQAKAAAHRLSDRHIDRIFSSPRGRARETARYTAEELGLPVAILDFMTEIAWGFPEQTWQERSRDHHPWKCSDKLAEANEDLLNYDYNTWEHYAGSLWEQGFSTVTAGLDAFLSEQGFCRDGRIYRAERQNRETLAIFAHGGAGTCVISHLLNLPMPYVCSVLNPSFASISEFQFSPNENGIVVPKICVLNEYSHLAERPAFRAET